MKKILYSILVAVAAFAVSCSKDDGSQNEDGGFTGTWLMRANEHHYFDATFNSNGTYEWEWKGVARFKDTGSYTEKDGVITMTPEKLYESDYETGELVQVSLSDFQWSGPRKVTILSVEGGVAWWKWEGDFLMQNTDDFTGGIMIFKKGYNFNIKKSDLLGTWEIKREDGFVESRIVIGDGTFSWYDAYEQPDAECGIAVRKDSGTWTLDENVLQIKATGSASSAKSLGYNQSLGKNEYIYSNVNPETLEADQWYSTTVNWDSTYYIYLKDSELSLGMAGVFARK